MATEEKFSPHTFVKIHLEGGNQDLMGMLFQIIILYNSFFFSFSDATIRGIYLNAE